MTVLSIELVYKTSINQIISIKFRTSYVCYCYHNNLITIHQRNKKMYMQKFSYISSTSMYKMIYFFI